MTLKINDRVYHTNVKANGFIEEIDESKKKDKYKVRYYWARHVEHPVFENRPYSRFNSRWSWASEDNLMVMPTIDGPNKVSIRGSKGLDKLIAHVCELPRRTSPNDGSHIVVNYGGSADALSSNVFGINRRLVTNKFVQCQLMHDLVPLSVSIRPPDGDDGVWISKPFQSQGGNNIFKIRPGHQNNPNTSYCQEFFPKVREFRAHVFLWLPAPVALVQEKFIDNKDQLCWNKEQGGHFMHPYCPTIGRMKMQRKEPQLLNTIMEQSIRACKLLHYDMGGVDLGVDAHGNVKVFEVNSRMGLREQALVVYKYALQSLRTININEYRRTRWV